VPRRMLRSSLTLLAICAATAVAQSDSTPRTQRDSMILRARKLADDGNAADARRLLDSVLLAAPPESRAFSEALYWRAATATTAVDAERDYRRLLVEAPLSERAEDAMLQLAQLEQARGDRRAATEHFQRFVLSYPDNPARPRAVVALTRLLFDQGLAARGCQALRQGRDIVPQASLELRNQLEFYAPRCVDFETAPAAAESSATRDTATRQKPPATSPPVTSPPATAPPTTSFYSVQVAAYDTKAPADRMVRTLKARGHDDARVDGTTRPFRVRLGKYRTRAAAVQALAALKAQGQGGFVTLVKGTP